MPPDTAVDGLYREAVTIIGALERLGESSLQIAAGNHFRKALLLAGASFFEHRVSGAVLDFVRERAAGSALVESFVRNKAVSRQYHTWFSWKDTNANQFFGLFGEEFSTVMKKRVKESDDLRLSIRAFMELGAERNKLVHQDYATFPLEKTLDEIYSLYLAAIPFVEGLPAALRDVDSATGITPPAAGGP